jgi:hypothetical protein
MASKGIKVNNNQKTKQNKKAANLLCEERRGRDVFRDQV